MRTNYYPEDRGSKAVSLGSFNGGAEKMIFGEPGSSAVPWSGPKKIWRLSGAILAITITVWRRPK
jgi:hypothetical protein